MSPRTQTLLSEHNIYVSWGILLLAITCTAMVARMMTQLEGVAPAIRDIQNFDQSIDKRVTTIETNFAWLDKNFTFKITP